jgi:hypothetical protein
MIERAAASAGLELARGPRGEVLTEVRRNSRSSRLRRFETGPASVTDTAQSALSSYRVDCDFIGFAGNVRCRISMDAFVAALNRRDGSEDAAREAAEAARSALFRAKPTTVLEVAGVA